MTDERIQRALEHDRTIDIKTTERRKIFASILKDLGEEYEQEAWMAGAR